MITRETVDSLRYGERVRLEIDGEVLEGPVTGWGGYKEVQGRALRLSDGARGEMFQQVEYSFIDTGYSTQMTRLDTSTGYPDYVLEHGTLTRLEH